MVKLSLRDEIAGRRTKNGKRHPYVRDKQYVPTAVRIGLRTKSFADSQARIALPSPDDTSSTLLSKLDQIVDCLAQGQSLAGATDYAKSTVSNHDAAEIALSQMTPQEYENWNAFLKGNIQLPTIDWDVNYGETPTSKKGLQKARRRAEALNRLYSCDRAQPSHSVWFTAHHILYLPLVKAMARVIGAERQLGQTNQIDMLDLADLQTIRDVISTSSPINQQCSSISKAQSNGINRKIQLLISHQRKIQQKRRTQAELRRESTVSSRIPSIGKSQTQREQDERVKA